MKTYSYSYKYHPTVHGYIEAETAGRAKYRLWLKTGRCDYQSFKDFLNDVRIRVVRGEYE